MSLLSDTWRIVDLVVNRLDEQKGPLGLAFVGKYETRIPSYPAVIVIPVSREKVLHATNTFNLNVVLQLYVYHGDMTQTKRQRSEEDLKLVERIEAELEKDYGWKASDSLLVDDRQVIFAYVADEEFGVLQPRSNKSSSMICTRLTWRALSQRRFT